MKDRFFYPIASVVIAAIIGLALLPGRGNRGLSGAEILAQGYVLSGNNLQHLTSGPGTLVGFANDEAGMVTHVIASTNLPKNMVAASAGLFGTLGPNYERAFGGKELKITVRARASGDNPLEQFQAAYFTGGAGSSGWKNFALTPEYSDYSFTFTPRKSEGKAGVDYIGIWPGIEGKGQTMDVKFFKVEVAG